MKKSLCIFGEVLFDIFPDGRRVLGGAPFNVAWHLQAFNQNPVFVSRIGDDQLGDSIRRSMIEWGMDITSLQVDKSLPTGRVTIRFNNDEPEYDIASPSAYDAIEAGATELKSNTLLYHGSLAIRHPESANALDQLIGQGPSCVFVDVNLRPPWYKKNNVLGLLGNAHWVKLNAGEFELLYRGQDSMTDRLSSFVKDFELQGVILTKGEDGAEVLMKSNEHFSVRPESDIDISDTVGAGDAFTSVIIMGLTNDWPMQETLNRAQQFASCIVGQRGATVSDRDFYRNIISSWNN